MNEFNGKIPPQAVDIEEAVLGALMLDKSALSEVIDILHIGAFYKESHQIIFESVKRLFESAKPIDILTVTNELKVLGKLDEVGGAYYVTQLTSRIGNAANIEYHSRILLQKYIQRQMIKVSGEIGRLAYDDKLDVFDLLDKAGSEFYSISESAFKRDYKDMPTLSAQTVKELESIKTSENGLRGVPTGFKSIDKFTSGWQKTDLIVMAARPGMGKTALAIQFAKNAALNNFPVAVFSLEMSDTQLMNRLISSESEIFSDKLKTGDLNDLDWNSINKSVNKINDLPLYIDDTPSLTIFELRAKCRRLKDQKNIQFIVIDYIQLMMVRDHKGNREQEISIISRSLKAIAKELDIPVLVLSQLNRSVESRGGSKRPMLSDLRESGAIEQDADMVVFLYRPEYYGITHDENEQDTTGLCEFIYAKHRSGSLGTSMLRFIGGFTKFTNYEDQASESDPF